MPNKPLTIKNLMEAAIPGAREVNESWRNMVAEPFGDLIEAFKQNPRETLRGFIDPISQYESTLASLGKAKKHPNLENMMEAIGSGMMTTAPIGAVKYTHGRGGLPVMRDPQTGVQFGPSSKYYFGRLGNDVEIEDNLAKIRRMLESSQMQPEMFTQDVINMFGRDAPGARASIGITPKAMYGSGAPTQQLANMTMNTAEAGGQIPLSKPITAYLDPSLAHYGAAGEFVPATQKPYVRLQPDKQTISGALPHELQHWEDYSRNTPLWSVGAGDFMDTGYMINTPVAAVNRFMAESRAELAAERFKNWLRTNGVMHWWDEPGAWPR